MYGLRSEIWLPRALEDVFAFFADAGNLEQLTPPWLRFEIVTQMPIQMRVGARIDYRLHLRGLPIRWQSEITVWDPPRTFVDEQRRGPYRSWRHQHTFVERDGGTLVGDHVEYATPGGSLVHRFLIRPDLEKIFDYRRLRLQALFGSSTSSA